MRKSSSSDNFILFCLWKLSEFGTDTTVSNSIPIVFCQLLLMYEHTVDRAVEKLIANCMQFFFSLHFLTECKLHDQSFAIQVAIWKCYAKLTAPCRLQHSIEQNEMFEKMAICQAFFSSRIFNLWYNGGTVYIGECTTTMAMTTPRIESVNVLGNISCSYSSLARVWLHKHIPIITNKRQSGNAKWKQAGGTVYRVTARTKQC